MLKNNTGIRKTAFAGMMLAMSLIIYRLLSIDSIGVIVTISSVPLAFCAITLGPYYGAAICVLYDILKVIVISGKSYDYVFSFSAALYGLIIGIAFLKTIGKPSTSKLYIVIFIAEFVQSTLLNTFFLMTRYDMSLMALIPLRLPVLIASPIITAYFCKIMLGVSEKAGIIKFRNNNK